MSNGWKSGKVAHVFGFQLRDRIPIELSRFRFLLLLFTLVPDLPLFPELAAMD
jgi:hypothetical protein